MLRGLRVSLLVAGGAGLGWCIGLNVLSLIRMFFEPNSLDAPPTHNITTVFVHQTAVDVGTQDDKDILQWLRENAREDDFVALKFDVDNDFSLGPTMEWGFLADLLRRPEALALVEVQCAVVFEDGQRQRRRRDGAAGGAVARGCCQWPAEARVRCKCPMPDRLAPCRH